MKEVLQQIRKGAILSQVQASDCFAQLFETDVADDQIAEFLTLLQQRGVAASEIVGFLEYLGKVSVRCSLDSECLFDVCGTGGDGKNTINISTLTAFILAAMGEQVAKHGNYSASSTVGSSNLLEALGVPFVDTEERAQELFAKAGIIFLHAPLWHPKLKRVAAVRKALGFRTVFNLLGPLLNPAHPKYQIIGVPNRSLATLLREVLVERVSTKNNKFLILSDENGYDEISLTANATAFSVEHIKELSVKDFGTAVLDPSSLQLPETLAETVKVSEELLAGKGQVAHQAVVAANVAMALTLRYPEISLNDHFQSARHAISSGQGLEVLNILRSAG